MIERFRELTAKQKIGAIALVIAFVGFVIFFISGLVNQSNSEESTPQETTQSAPLTTDDPTAEATETPSASPSPTSSDEASQMPAIEYGTGNLSDEESLQAQSFANTAIEEFLKWNPGETREARANRISGYIVADSAVREMAPDLRQASSYENDEGKPAIASTGSIDYINAVGGDESRYRVTMGIVLRIQYNYDDNAEQKSSVIREASTISVDLTKQNGEWKILEISNS